MVNLVITIIYLAKQDSGSRRKPNCYGCRQNKKQFLAKIGAYLNPVGLSWRQKINNNLAELCEGLPQPKLRVMVGGTKKRATRQEIRTTIV
jgi:hypothetical protein